MTDTPTAPAGREHLLFAPDPSALEAALAAIQRTGGTAEVQIWRITLPPPGAALAVGPSGADADDAPPAVAPVPEPMPEPAERRQPEPPTAVQPGPEEPTPEGADAAGGAQGCVPGALTSKLGRPNLYDWDALMEEAQRIYHTFLCKLAVESNEEALRNEARRERDRARKAKGITNIVTPSAVAGVAMDAADAVDASQNPDDGAVDAGDGPAELQDRSSGIPAEIALQNRTRQDLSPQAPRGRGDHPQAGAVLHRVSSSDSPRRPRRAEPEPPAPAGIGGSTDDAVVWKNRLSGGPGRMWLGSWGPRPDEPGCAAPAWMIQASPWGQGMAMAA